MSAYYHQRCDWPCTFNALQIRTQSRGLFGTRGCTNHHLHMIYSPTMFKKIRSPLSQTRPRFWVLWSHQLARCSKSPPPPHPTPIISDGKNNTTLIHLATRHACCWLDFVVFDYDAFFFLEDKCNMSKNCLAQQRDQQHAHLSSFIQFIHVSLDIHESLCSFIDIKSHNFERTINCIKVHNITQHDFVATLVQEIVQGPFFSCVGSPLQNEHYFYHSNWSLLQG